MEYIHDIMKYESDRPCVITLGKFDGVHKGHRKLIRKAGALAAKAGGRSAVFTFTVSPQVMMGERQMKMITTNRERDEILRELGIDLLVECPFTEELRSMTPEDFVRELLVGRLHASAVVVGTDARFGKNRAGDAALLVELGDRYGFEVYVEEKEKDGDREISSSYVRERIAEGDMKRVQNLLSYPYFIAGEVVHGRHLGHTLGFPTINTVPPAEKMLPPRGVYFTRTLVGGKWYQGISNLGIKPTVDGSQVGLETYLFDCSLDLYGQEARVEFLQFRRSEKKFESVEALKNQMDEDIQAADKFFQPDNS
jgi:riboflavin kinase/FMN adenylyltransferase